MPLVALSLGMLVVMWLFWKDMRMRTADSWALLIPGLWLTILGSRPLGYWFGTGATNKLEGSPFDRLVYLVLILAAIAVLLQRRVDLAAIFKRNKALSLFFLYLLISTLWSYYPVVSFKRWTKILGCALMTLVILTEHSPVQAIRIVFVRCSYVLLPLSVVTAKYFPNVGRLLSRSWENMITGLTTHKNALGQVVMVFGFMVVWDALEMRKQRRTGERPPLFGNHIIILLCGLWLLIMCHSRTALVCMVLGGLVLCGSGPLLRMHRPQRGLIGCAVAVAGLFLLDQVFSLSAALLEVMGREKSLTGRTELWRLVGNEHLNPLVGCGFSGFWDRPIDSELAGYVESGFVTAHNGYLEIYLGGGLLGLIALGLMLMAAFGRVTKRLLAGTFWGRISFVFVIITMIYNWSESDFFGFEPLWVTFLLAIIDCPVYQHQTTPLNESGNPASNVLLRTWESFDR